MKHKKQLLVIVSLLLLIVLTGCIGKKYTYSVAKRANYLGGRELVGGPAVNPVDVELTLSSRKIREGVDVSFDYYGVHYHGTVKSGGKIDWDKAPVLFAEGVFSSSVIENYNSGIKITFNYTVRALSAKSILVFSAK